MGWALINAALRPFGLELVREQRIWPAAAAPRLALRRRLPSVGAW